MQVDVKSLPPVNPNSSPAIVPPFRFGAIEENLYRGGFPRSQNYRFLKRLKIETVISLVPEENVESVALFCRANNIRHVHLPVDKAKDHVPLTKHQVVATLQVCLTNVIHLTYRKNLLEHKEYGRTYLHCLDGSHTTGVVVMMWTMNATVLEFCRYSRDGSILPEETEFVNKFGLSSLHSSFVINVTLTTLPQSEGSQDQSNEEIQVESASVSSSSSSGTELELPDRDLPNWLWNNGDLSQVFVKSVQHASTSVSSSGSGNDFSTWNVVLAHPSCRVKFSMEHCKTLVKMVLTPSIVASYTQRHLSIQETISALTGRPSSASTRVSSSASSTTASAHSSGPIATSLSLAMSQTQEPSSRPFSCEGVRQGTPQSNQRIHSNKTSFSGRPNMDRPDIIGSTANESQVDSDISLTVKALALEGYHE